MRSANAAIAPHVLSRKSFQKQNYVNSKGIQLVAQPYVWDQLKFWIYFSKTTYSVGSTKILD